MDNEGETSIVQAHSARGGEAKNGVLLSHSLRLLVSP